MTMITLTNGIKVVNFSSPHSFTFEDGSVLPAVSADEAQRLAVTFIEDDSLGDWSIQLKFELTANIVSKVIEYMEAWRRKEIDIVLVPLPMLTALKEKHGVSGMVRTPFRCIRTVDRVSKRISTTQFCL